MKNNFTLSIILSLACCLVTLNSFSMSKDVSMQLLPDTPTIEPERENTPSFYIGSDVGGSFSRSFDKLKSTNYTLTLNPELGIISKRGYTGTFAFGYQRDRSDYTIQDYLWNTCHFGAKIGKQLKINKLVLLSRIGANQNFQVFKANSDGLSLQRKTSWKSAVFQTGIIWSPPFKIEIIPLLNVEYGFDHKTESGEVWDTNVKAFLSISFRYTL